VTRPTADAVPAYFHPDREREDWEALLRSARRGRVGLVVLNPASGLGSGTDPAYVRVCLELSAIPGLAVAGYVDTAYGTRPAGEILDEARGYCARYGIRGVFADQVPSGPAQLADYRALAGRLRAAGLGPVVLNPGVVPHPEYLEIGDVVVTFEGTWESYRVDPPAPVRGPALTWHLVHGTPPAEIAATRGTLRADLGYVTDRFLPNPWDGLPREALR
jgi:hypothetical protein